MVAAQNAYSLEFPHFGGGVDESTAITHLPLHTASAMSNMDYTEWPAVSVRAGSAKLNATAISANPITGLFDVGFSGGTRALLAKCGTALYKWNTGTSAFDSVATGLTAGNVRFCVYKDTAIMFGPDAPKKSTDGTTWAALGGSPPTAKYCITHADRVFALNASGYESILYFSALEDAEDWTTTTGAGAAGSIPIDTNDGTVGTGLWELRGWGRLLAGKERALYLLRGTGPSDFTADYVTRRAGPVSQEAGVVTPSGEFYFAARDGIYRYSGYGAPEQIQQPVQATWDTLNKSYYSRIAAGHTNSGGVERVLFAIPTGSATVPDKVLVYYPRWNVWSVWSGIAPYLFATIQVGGVDYLAWGDDAGFVWKGLQGTQDGATDVAWSRETGVFPLGDRNVYHYLERVTPVFKVESAGTASVAYDTAASGSYGTASTVDLATEAPTKHLWAPFASGEDTRAHQFRVKVYGTAGPATLRGMTVQLRKGGV